MRIIANTKISKVETRSWFNSDKPFEIASIRRELSQKVGAELEKYSPLFYETEIMESSVIEHRMELFVFNKDSLKGHLYDLQDRYNIPDQVMKELWNKLMNTI
jgi:hypothetical protein